MLIDRGWTVNAAQSSVQRGHATLLGGGAGPTRRQRRIRPGVDLRGVTGDQRLRRKFHGANHGSLSPGDPGAGSPAWRITRLSMGAMLLTGVAVDRLSYTPVFLAARLHPCFSLCAFFGLVRVVRPVSSKTETIRAIPR